MIKKIHRLFIILALIVNQNLFSPKTYSLLELKNLLTLLIKKEDSRKTRAAIGCVACDGAWLTDYFCVDCNAAQNYKNDILLEISNAIWYIAFLNCASPDANDRANVTALDTSDRTVDDIINIFDDANILYCPDRERYTLRYINQIEIDDAINNIIEDLKCSKNLAVLYVLYKNLAFLKHVFLDPIIIHKKALVLVEEILENSN